MKSIFLTIIGLMAISQPDQFLSVGDVAPEISQTGLDGKTVLNLTDLRGKVVLIDFWASWCKPCRKENPEIVRVYQKYKTEAFKNGSGFEVFSVSLDKSQAAWEKAISTDGLIWDTHTSDLNGWKNAVAKKYRISSVPFSYLIDGEGKVIAVNPRGGKLEKELKSFKKSSSWFSSWF